MKPQRKERESVSLKELLGHPPAVFQYVDVVDEIWEYGRHDLLLSLTIAISYGVILGKRMERARRKAAQKEGTTT